MKAKILLSIIALVPVLLNAQLPQLVKVEPINVQTNFEETLHLIFPSEIRYFSSIDKYVSVDNPKSAKFILRLKSTERSFKEKTNISVATADGQFYNFSATYSKELPFTNLYLNDTTSIIPESIGLNKNTETHLVFNNPIKYIDIGDLSITANIAENTQNILHIRVDSNSTKTNISVVTDDNKFYTYNARYEENPETAYYADFQVTKKEEKVLLENTDLTDTDRKYIKKHTDQFKRNLYYLGEMDNGIIFSIYNIFIKDNFLFFKCCIENKSSIPYYTEYTKFTIVDKKVPKRTASQELELPVLYSDNYKSEIEPGEKLIYTLGFETFTIPDKKILKIEVNEKNGGRHMFISLDNNDLINGQTL